MTLPHLLGAVHTGVTVSQQPSFSNNPPVAACWVLMGDGGGALLFQSAFHSLLNTSEEEIISSGPSAGLGAMPKRDLWGPTGHTI